MSTLDDYYKQLQGLNQQRGMTGNAQANQGMDASLAQGYLDSEYKNKNSQQQFELQKQGQAFNQNYMNQQMDNQKSAQTNSLIGQAVGGVANLGMQAYSISKQSGMINSMLGRGGAVADSGGAVTGASSGMYDVGNTAANAGNYAPMVADASLGALTPLESFDMGATTATDAFSSFDYGSSFSWMDSLGMSLF